MRHFTSKGIDQSMSKRFIKSPYSISRATSIDSDCCRLTTASDLRNKADKSPSNQFWSTSPSFFKATRHAEIRKFEIPTSMVVEALSWRSWRASERPEKPCVSLTNALRILPVRRFLLALVGRKQTVVRDQDSPHDSRAQGFGTPLARQRSRCPLPSPNLVRTHPIDQAFRDSASCLSLITFSRRAPNWSSKDRRT